MRATLLFARVAVNWQAEGHFFKVPEFLNCEGTTFDPIWSVFRESAILNAQAGYPRNESLRDMAVELISTYEPSMIVGTRAWVVRLRTAATGDVYHLRSHLGEDAEDAVFSLPSSDIGLKATLGPSQSQAERDPMEFCLYGYVQALFIEFRHTIPVNEEGSGLPDNDPRLATCHDRRPLLEVAEQLLGGETCETNFLESSDWPLNSLDLHLSLHSTLALRSSSDCHVIFKAEDYISRPLEASWVPVPESELLQDSFQLRIAALGLHVASTLEPVAALREVARAGEGSSIDISYFGHPCYGRPGDKTLKHACVYKCQMLGSPCEDDPIAELLKSMFNSSGFYEEVAWSPQEALEVLGHEWRRQSSLAEADLIVCSGPLALCYLVDILAPATFMVMTLCSQLLWGAPPGEHVGTMLLGQVRLMSHNPRRALVACNLFAASQCLYQTGVELPVVERVAHYLPHGVYWGSTGAESHWKEVLVLRARYWHRLPGQNFMDVLEAFLRTNEFGHNFTFVMAASFGPDELPPEEIARYRAAVLVPNDLTVFAFIEVYALGVPTFVPLPSWLYRLRRAAPFGFLQRSLSLPDLTGVRDRFKYPPFLSNDREDFAAFLHWQQTSELHTRPHVQQFGSVPHLLYITASADLLAISKGMKEYNSQLRNISATCWSSVLQRFSGSSRATPVGIVSSMQTAATSWVDAGGTGLQAVLDCSSDEYGAWNAFRLEFQSNAALGFVVNWELQAMAQSLWNSVQGLPENFAAASALFHQVLLGDAPPGLVLSSGHCHYGLVSALFILARHRKTKADTAELAMRMLGGFAALDFLEDSAWPLSSLDLAKMMSQGEDFCHFDANGARLRSIIEANLPWTLQFDTFHVASPAENVKTKPKLKSWKAAIVGAHPSLCADIAHAVDRALGGQSEHQYFGLSCPGHHSASHHCTFRCEVLGQCSNDAMFDRILGQMLNWGEFTERPFDPKVLLNELRKIVSSSKFLSSADLQICTGPYVLCHMMQLILDVPLLVYLGLTLTYLAAENVEELLLSARSIASDFTNLAGAVGPRRRALVVTDLIRAAQFHHATGVWVPALPPLSFYHADPAQGGRHHRAKRVEAIALRPELWRRAAFGPGLRGLLRHFCNSNTGVAFQTHFLPLRRILSYDAAILVPWDNDVMSFYELYHAAMPLLMPSEMLMSKWLPAVRWGSLEFDRDRGTGSAKRPACLMRLGKSPACFVPWMNQSTLQSAMDGGAASWIGATDYYRFPHILHFHSVASLVGKLQGPLAATRSGMRKASQEIRSQTLSLHRRLLGHLLGFGDSERFPRFMPTQAPNHWNQLPLGGTCKLGFIAQADFPQIEPHSSPFLGLRQCLRLCDETAGCEVAVFNGLTCMVYDEFCNATDLRREGDRNGYVAWKRD